MSEHLKIKDEYGFHSKNVVGDFENLSLIFDDLSIRLFEKEVFLLSKLVL